MFPPVLRHRRTSGTVGWLLLAGSLVVLTGCGGTRAEAESRPRAGQPGATSQAPAAVNVAIAREGTVREQREYTGTTQPVRLVSLRSQVEGQVLDLSVDVGDAVQQGQILARIDGAVLSTNVAEAQAEVAARQSEVAQARIAVSDAQTQVNRARAELQQAQSDLNRLQFLGSQGAIPEQQVEQARTRVSTAQATLQSAQEQVRTRQQAVEAAQGRVSAQQAVVAREQERQSYTTLTSPVTGSVVEQTTEAGNLVQPGGEVLRLGDFSQVKVAVQISELELGNIRPGQSVQVRLDAFPDQTFTGRVSRISPAADPVARLVPVEVTIPNTSGRIGSGLLARVTFNQQTNRSRIVIPEVALQAGENQRSGPPRNAGNQAQAGGNSSNSQGGRQPRPAAEGTNNQARGIGTLFIVEGTGNETTVAARQVTLGRRGDGQVEVLSGLQPGERFVARSSRALKNGDSVRLSILSEQAEQSN